jgi:hypothetical protein
MTRSTRHMLTRTATAAAAGTALLALSAAPVSAVEIPEPGAKPAAETSSTSSDGTPWMEIGVGALGGLVLVGAGVAAATTVRHRHAAHPA